MAILEVQDLTLRFGGLEVIDHLNFDVEEGSIVSLIGPNGAGKTSIFNCLTGFYRANSGDIRFYGQSVVKASPHQITQRGMARTFQNLRLFRSLSVMENVMSVSSGYMMPGPRTFLTAPMSFVACAMRSPVGVFWK